MMTDREFHDLMYGPEPEELDNNNRYDHPDEDYRTDGSQDQPIEQERYSVVATYSDASYRTWIVWGNRRKAQRHAASIRSGNHDGLMLVSVRPMPVTA